MRIVQAMVIFGPVKVTFVQVRVLLGQVKSQGHICHGEGHVNSG